ncbi:MAG: type II toxin-antitoxin system RelE/ParE family toxin [Burkholderiaceae bacterium]
MSKTYRVLFSPESQAHLAALYRYIAAAGSPLTALDYTEAIVITCETLANFPDPGVRRDDVRPELRTTHHRGQVVIAYAIIDDDVHILGIYYGGQDYESLIRG